MGFEWERLLAKKRILVIVTLQYVFFVMIIGRWVKKQEQKEKRESKVVVFSKENKN